MTRLPGTSPGAARTTAPDVYTVLLLVGVLFLLVACVVVYLDLTQNYGLEIGQLFKGNTVPK